MSYDPKPADMPKLSDFLKSRSIRTEIQTASNAARTLQTKVKLMKLNVDSFGQVPDDQVDNSVAFMDFYSEVQELFTLIPTLTHVSVLLEKMNQKALELPLSKVRVVKSAKTVAKAIPVDSEVSGNGNFGDGGSQETDAYTMMVDAGLSPAEIEEALADIQRNVSGKQSTFQGVPLAALGGAGNPGPIPVDIKPVPPAPVLGGGGAGLVPEGNKRSFNDLLAGLTSEIAGGRAKKQARVMPQAPLEASAQVKKEPGFSAAQIAQAATDNAARKGLSETVDLVSSDDE
jgi:hypothetical protein